jgi:predicted 2-oxoglutarate/Fe(II)-dependent dioxygenase YbiX|tara:strand:- start:1058 stop:1678 length:621 start_codon:yes stop_codon:yes gene_type:complete
MAYQSIWYYSDLPEEIVEIIEKDLSEKYQDQMDESRLHGNALDKEKRNSRNAWIPTTEWVGGFIWHYITRANRENFLYDLTCIDGESIQFTEYGEGQFYSWHNDAGLATQYKPAGVGNHDSARVNDFMNEQLEQVRKLSFVVQLSNHDDYEGGNLQLMTESGKPYFAPRKRGTIILFDSRTQHRVLKVTKGVRKSLVGWTVGPRWK